MKCISWNIGGLESPDRKSIIKRFLLGHKNIDFFMMQELKAVNFLLNSSLDFIWRDAIKICTNHHKGKGGAALLINPYWGRYIKSAGSSPCNRVAWIVIEFNGTSFGVFSIYAPNEVKDRIILWDWLHNLANIPWILAGDFNMVENQDDKSGGLPFAWKHQEKFYWDRCKHKLNLFDPMEGCRRDDTSLWFTWCNFWQGSRRIYSRLDRFYVNSDFFSFSPNQQQSPVFASSSTLSDHLPIVALINIRNVWLLVLITVISLFLTHPFLMIRILILLLRWLGHSILLTISLLKLIDGIEMSPHGGKYFKP